MGANGTLLLEKTEYSVGGSFVWMIRRRDRSVLRKTPRYLPCPAGILSKINALISGADVGCQGEGGQPAAWQPPN
jgi:hypothetical protein